MSNKKPKNAQPKPLPVGPPMRIIALSNGSISVDSFPEDYNATMRLLHGAQEAVTKHFFRGIKENRYDEHGRKKGSNIVIAKPNQIPV